MRRLSSASIPNLIATGCEEVGEKFTVVGGWGRGHFDTNFKVTPTLVRLG